MVALPDWLALSAAAWTAALSLSAALGSSSLAPGSPAESHTSHIENSHSVFAKLRTGSLSLRFLFMISQGFS